MASRRRKDRDKIAKDLSQAAQLIDALWGTQRRDVIRALEEARDRGPAWEEALVASLKHIETELADDAGTVLVGVAKGAPG